MKIASRVSRLVLTSVEGQLLDLVLAVTPRHSHRRLGAQGQVALTER